VHGARMLVGPLEQANGHAQIRRTVQINGFESVLCYLKFQVGRVINK
jgi:hypothetical protein